MKEKLFNAFPGKSTKKSKRSGERMKVWTNKLVRVNEKGTEAEDTDGDPVAIIIDADGNKIGTTSWGSVVRIDEAVAVAWLDRPYDGKAYFVNHKDGDKENCQANNLEWKPVCGSTTADSVFIDDYIVHKDGSITAGDVEMRLIDHMYDEDLGLNVAHKLPIGIRFTEEMLEPESVDYYDLLKKAGYIQGDKSSLEDPVVLHIDADRNNLQSKNLLWVEADDARYIAFDKKNEVARKNRNMELNPEKLQALIYFKLI